MIQMVTLDSKKVALEIAKQNYTIKDFSKKMWSSSFNYK